jgi:hypothetical protein
MAMEACHRFRACTVGLAKSLRIASSSSSFHWRATEGAACEEEREVKQMTAEKMIAEQRPEKRTMSVS